MATGQTRWGGDPALAADPTQAQVVVAANLAFAKSTTDTDQIAASLSFDGGHTFVATQLVADGSCADGEQDQEAIAFDPTTSPATVWFAWRHKGLGTYGACVRGGTVNAGTRQINWLGPSQEVQNLDRTPFYGIGGLLVQAGNQAVTVVYSNTDHAFFECEADKQVRWFSVTSNNNGANWTSSHEIYDSQEFDWCVFNNTTINSLRAFGFIRDLGGAYWVAVHDSHERIRVFMSTDLGTSWSQVHLIYWQDGAGDVLFPTLAADGAGRIALSFWGSLGPLVTQRQIAIGQGSSEPAVWSLPTPISGLQLAPPGSPGGSNFQNTTLSRALGDYDGVSAIDPTLYPSPGGETFAAAWASRELPITPVVAMAYVAVAP